MNSLNSKVPLPDKSSLAFHCLFGTTTLQVEDCLDSQGNSLHRSFVEYHDTQVELSSSDHAVYDGDLQRWFYHWASVEPPTTDVPASQRPCTTCGGDASRRTARRCPGAVLRLPRILVIQSPTSITQPNRSDGGEMWQDMEQNPDLASEDHWVAPLSLNIPGTATKYERVGLVQREGAHFTCLVRPPGSLILVEYDDLSHSGRVQPQRLDSIEALDERFGVGAPTAFTSVYILRDDPDDVDVQHLIARNREAMFMTRHAVRNVNHSTGPHLWYHIHPVRSHYQDADFLSEIPRRPASTPRRRQLDYLCTPAHQTESVTDLGSPTASFDLLHQPKVPTASSDSSESDSSLPFSRPYLHESRPPTPTTREWTISPISSPTSKRLKYEPIPSTPRRSSRTAAAPSLAPRSPIPVPGRLSNAKAQKTALEWLDLYQAHPICTLPIL